MTSHPERLRLILVYHLHRDLDFAVERFDTAIRIGTAQLDELPAKEDDESAELRARRNFLEEAVGDAAEPGPRAPGKGSWSGRWRLPQGGHLLPL